MLQASDQEVEVQEEVFKNNDEPEQAGEDALGFHEDGLQTERMNEKRQPKG